MFKEFMFIELETTKIVTTDEDGTDGKHRHNILVIITTTI